MTLVTQTRARIRQVRHLARAYAALAFFPRHRRARRHSLPGELTVSLTSYPPRFPGLAATLKSLLDQRVKPDRTVLWIAEGDFAQLTPAILALQDHGLQILRCEDLRSYKKIVPTLEQWPDSFIVTADDDIYYPPDWLEGIVEHFDPEAPAIVCRRAHRPTRQADGTMRPYAEWDTEFIQAPSDPAREDLMPTGIGGVLYYPGVFAKQVTDVNAFRQHCPSADDLWLYWMARMNGARYQQVGGPFLQISWPHSQRHSLAQVNVGHGENDRQVRALEACFGPC